jgi:hypothetical protein
VENLKILGGVLLMLLGSVCFWWIPCAVAFARRHPNTNAIRMLNLLCGLPGGVVFVGSAILGSGVAVLGLGVALLGWGIAFIWALTNPK